MIAQFSGVPIEIRRNWAVAVEYRTIRLARATSPPARRIVFRMTGESDSLPTATLKPFAKLRNDHSRFLVNQQNGVLSKYKSSDAAAAPTANQTIQRIGLTVACPLGASIKSGYPTARPTLQASPASGTWTGSGSPASSDSGPPELIAVSPPKSMYASSTTDYRIRAGLEESARPRPAPTGRRSVRSRLGKMIPPFGLASSRRVDLLELLVQRHAVEAGCLY